MKTAEKMRPLALQIYINLTLYSKKPGFSQYNKTSLSLFLNTPSSSELNQLFVRSSLSDLCITF